MPTRKAVCRRICSNFAHWLSVGLLTLAGAACRTAASAPSGLQHAYSNHDDSIAVQEGLYKSAAKGAAASTRARLRMVSSTKDLTRRQVVCRPATAKERCDGVDEDCDGRIDEGCGYRGGILQVTLHWDQPVDLDLHVLDASGERISMHHPRSASGGTLDHAGRGNCAPSLRPSNIENVYWGGPGLELGDYRIGVFHWGSCMSGSDAVKVTLSVAAFRRVSRSYTVDLDSTHRRELLRLELSAATAGEDRD